MADEQNQLLHPATSLDGRLAAKQEAKETDGSEILPEDMTTVPDTRDVAASRNAVGGSRGRGD